jgi:signal transduction histidine kinase
MVFVDVVAGRIAALRLRGWNLSNMHTDATNSAPGFQDYGETAGLGSLIWGAQSQFLVRYFHYVVAAFTGAILFLVTVPYSWQLATAIVAAYLLYVGVRKIATRHPVLEQRFYRQRVQLLRAELAWLMITALLLIVPGAAASALWLLYIPILMMVSRHCKTEHLIILYMQSALALIYARVQTLPWLPDRSGFYLAADILAMGLLAYVIHYLVRNIDARNRTIAGYRTIQTIIRRYDATEPSGAVEWRPMLDVLLRQLNAECVSLWMVESKTHQIRRAASVRHNMVESDWLGPDEPAGGVISIDDAGPLAEAARRGTFWRGEATKTAGMPELCPNVAEELIFPISVGSGPHQTVLGVLGIGFCARSFHERLLSEYREFIESLLVQARPMLAYARRLDELLALQKTGQAVAHSLDLDEVLNSILQTVVDTLGFEFAVISLVDEDRRLIRSDRGLNVPPGWLNMSVHPLDSTDIQADVVRSGRVQVITGWDDRFDRHIWEQFKHNEMIRVFTPIEVAAGDDGHAVRVIGTIEAGYHLATRSDISSDQLRMLEAFKDQAALAIEHAQLMQRARQRADILASLHTVGQAVASARESDEVLKVLVNSAAQLLNADIVMVYPYHRERNQIDPPTIAGNVWGKWRLNLNAADDNILTRQLHANDPHYSADAQDTLVPSFNTDRAGAPAGKPKATFTRRQNIKSLACLPLIAQGETVGLMFVNYRSRHQFGPDERQVHELFAQQAASAIKNSQSYELARELIIRQERDHLSREIHHTVSQSLFGIKLQAQNAIHHLPIGNGAVFEELSNILENAHVASVETGFILDELRAPIAEGRRLPVGLQEYARRAKKWYNYDVQIEYDLPDDLPVRLQQTLLRFAREAMNNAVRHSKSKTIRVGCQFSASGLELAVSDEGVGFNPDRVSPNKLGLTSMRELATAANGFFYLDTAFDRGTRVTLTIPPDRVQQPL